MFAQSRSPRCNGSRGFPANVPRADQRKYHTRRAVLGAGDDFNRQRSDRRLLAKGWTPCSDGSASIDMDQHGTATPGQSFRRSGTGTDMMENSMLVNRRILVLDLAGALAIPMAAPSYAAPAPTATAAVRASAR
jgi:hypothetical protein